MEFLKNEERLLNAIVEADVSPIDHTGRTNISEGFNRLMMSCFKINPNERPTIDNILDDPYLIEGKNPEILAQWR